MGMATNGQTSKYKVLHENRSIFLSISVCVHIFSYLYLFCGTVRCCDTMLIVPKKILTCQNVREKTHYCKNVFEHFWRKKTFFHMGCTKMKKPPSQTLLDYNILLLAVSRWWEGAENLLIYEGLGKEKEGLVFLRVGCYPNAHYDNCLIKGFLKC